MVASLPSSIPSQVEQLGQQKAVRLQLAREGCCSSPALTLSAALAACPTPGPSGRGLPAGGQASGEEACRRSAAPPAAAGPRLGRPARRRPRGRCSRRPRRPWRRMGPAGRPRWCLGPAGWSWRRLGQPPAFLAGPAAPDVQQQRGHPPGVAGAGRRHQPVGAEQAVQAGARRAQQCGLLCSSTEAVWHPGSSGSRAFCADCSASQRTTCCTALVHSCRAAFGCQRLDSFAKCPSASAPDPPNPCCACCPAARWASPRS